MRRKRILGFFLCVKATKRSYIYMFIYACIFFLFLFTCFTYGAARSLIRTPRVAKRTLCRCCSRRANMVNVLANVGIMTIRVLSTQERMILSVRFVHSRGYSRDKSYEKAVMFP